MATNKSYVVMMTKALGTPIAEGTVNRLCSQPVVATFSTREDAQKHIDLIYSERKEKLQQQLPYLHSAELRIPVTRSLLEHFKKHGKTLFPKLS